MEAQKARATTLRSFYGGHNVRRPEAVEQRIRHIQIARPLTTDRAVIAPAILHVQMIVACLRTQQTHIARLEARIAEAFPRHPEAAFFRQLPGAGAALAPRLLVAFGDDRGRYPNAAIRRRNADQGKERPTNLDVLAMECAHVLATELRRMGRTDGRLL